MNEAEVRARVVVRARTSERPALTDAEVDQLVADAKIADAAGRAPDHPDWTPTFDSWGAVADAWRMKAGRCAPKVNLTLDGGDTVALSQMYAHCMSQAATYDERRLSAIGSTGTPSATTAALRAGGALP